MAKRKVKKVEGVITSTAKFNPTQVTLALTGLSELRDLIRGFIHVKNPVGQAFQRFFAEVLESTIKVKGRKSSIKVTIPRFHCVAKNPYDGKRAKGQGSKFLKALTAKHVEDVNAVALASELLTYFASKLITSQDQKFEGALMAKIVTHIESSCGLKVESLSIGDKDFTRDAIEVKRKGQLHYLQVLLDADIAPMHRKNNIDSLGDNVPLL